MAKQELYPIYNFLSLYSKGDDSHFSIKSVISAEDAVKAQSLLEENINKSFPDYMGEHKGESTKFKSDKKGIIFLDAK